MWLYERVYKRAVTPGGGYRPPPGPFGTPPFAIAIREVLNDGMFRFHTAASKDTVRVQMQPPQLNDDRKYKKDGL